jgi:hypothetical protein
MVVEVQQQTFADTTPVPVTFHSEGAYTMVGIMLRRFVTDEVAGMLSELALILLLVWVVMRTCSGLASFWLEIRRRPSKKTHKSGNNRKRRVRENSSGSEWDSGDSED